MVPIKNFRRFGDLFCILMKLTVISLSKHSIEKSLTYCVALKLCLYRTVAKRVSKKKKKVMTIWNLG